MVSFWQLPVMWQKATLVWHCREYYGAVSSLDSGHTIYVPTLGVVLNRCIYDLTTSTLFVTFCRHSSRALDEHRDLCETRFCTESWVQVRYQNIFIYVHFSIDYQRIYTHWLISPFVYFIMRDYCSGCSILVEKCPPTSTGNNFFYSYLYWWYCDAAHILYFLTPVFCISFDFWLGFMIM